MTRKHKFQTVAIPICDGCKLIDEPNPGEHCNASVERGVPLVLPAGNVAGPDLEEVAVDDGATSGDPIPGSEYESVYCPGPDCPLAWEKHTKKDAQALHRF